MKTKKIFSLIIITFILLSALSTMTVNATVSGVGLDEIGSNTYNQINGRALINCYNISTGISETVFYAYLTVAWGSPSVTALIYNVNSSNMVDTLLFNQSLGTVTNTGWYSINTGYTIDAGQIAIGCYATGTDGGLSYNYNDVGTAYLSESATISNPFDYSVYAAQDRQYSFYVNGTETAEPTPTPSPTEPPVSTGNWICLGDSITHGDTANPKFPETLATLTGAAVYNAGTNGATSAYLLGVWRDTYSTQDYAYLTTMMGINDYFWAGVSTNFQVQDRLNEIWLDALTNHSYTAVFALTITPVMGAEGNTMSKQQIQANITATNAYIMNASAIDERIIPVDVYSLLEDSENDGYLNSTYDSGDGMHLNTAGATVIANAVYAAYLQFLEENPTPTPTATTTPTSTATPVIVEINLLSFIVLLLLLLLNVLLIAWNKVPLLNFIAGIMTIGIAALSIGSTELPYQPLFSLFIILMAILNLLSGLRELERN